MSLIGAAECARIFGVNARTWSTYPSRGLAPASVARGAWDEDEVRRWASPPVAQDHAIPSGEWGADSGCGRYGILDHTEDGRLICHECGRGVAHLSSHVRGHGITAGEYRARHGLPRSLPLVSPDVHHRQSQQWHDHADVALANLARHGDALAASGRSGNMGREKSAYTRHALSRPRGRSLAASEKRELLRCAGDVQAWCAVASRLRESGVTVQALADASGLKWSTAEARLRRGSPRRRG